MRLLPLAPVSFLHKMLRKKNITVNGRKAEGSLRLTEGDEIRLYLSEETIGKFLKDYTAPLTDGSLKDTQLSVLFEDGDIIAVMKEAGTLSQGGPGDPGLPEMVLKYLADSGAVSEESLAHFRPAPANRLDRNTSGIVLCGKTLAGQRFLTEAVRERQIRKIYAVIVCGRMERPEEKVSYLLKDGSTNTVSVSERPVSGASEIRTSFVPAAGNDRYTLVRAELHTGKSHQIRAQLMAMGYPVLGDPKYGDRKINKRFFKETGIRRQMLHALKVIFSEDTARPGLSVTAPYPEDFMRAFAFCGIADGDII